MQIPLARTRFDLFAVGVLIGYAAIFTALVWLVTGVLDIPDRALGVVLGALVVLWLLWSGLYVITWSRLRRIDVPLELRSAGLLARSQFGELEVPWAAVQSAAVERAWNGRRLRVRLVPPSAPERAGLVDRLNPKMMRVVEREGMRYSLRVLDVTVEALREAFVVQSGGRVRLG